MVRLSVHFFLVFRESNAVLNVPGQNRTICVQCTAADIPECTYVQSKSVQNKPSCAVEAVTSVYSRSNVLGCSLFTDYGRFKTKTLLYSACNARSMHGH